MLTTKKSTAGTLTRSNLTLAIFAATLVTGGTSTAASAHSRHYRVHHVSHDTDASQKGSWLDANASIGGHGFTGVASTYGNESGRQTASGQRFNENAMTCAHRSLPFGTKLRVTHGGRSVIVTVNDRGPFVRGRVLDLSTAAARAVGITSSGVGRVVAEVM